MRILSIDVLRGLTVAGMVLVNNGFDESFAMLRHSHWNGMTPCDLVFPFFLFIMGVSCHLSLSKSAFTPSPRVLAKVLRRALLLFALGLFINWCAVAVDDGALCFGHVRLWGVLQRIALCYLFLSLFALYVPHRLTLPAVAVLLVGYACLLLVGNGYSEDPSANILAQTDLRLFGYDHLYHHTPIDPEGLLGTIAGTAHVLLAFHCGSILRGGDVRRLFAFATVILIAGWLLSYGLPLNKCVWSPSFVLVTCGLASLLLALFVFLEDRLRSNPQAGRRAVAAALARFFRVFGVNALVLYVGSELMAVLFWHFGINEALYALLQSAIPWPPCAALIFASLMVSLIWIAGSILWKRRIIIKL